MKVKYITEACRIKNGLLIVLLFLAMIPFQSCVDTVPEEVLSYDDYYKDMNDADVAILGLYGQFMELASQVVVLNELRADLMDVTPNASVDLQAINISQPSPDNKWSNPIKFYTVIQSCNDILANYNLMLAQKKMTQVEYDERYSDVAALRTWVYFQLGLHFDKVPYITTPIVSPSDLKPYANKELKLDALVDSLILCMEKLPTLENYKSSKLVQSTIDGYSLAPVFINKKCLLGDLYLFANRYEDAAFQYRDVLATDEASSATKYKIYTWVTFQNSNFQVLYTRGKEDDEGSLQNYWINMFLASTTNRYVLDELIWFMPYDKKFAPEYPFTKLFNPSGVNGGQYLLMPSEYAVESIWGGETQRNGFPFDARGLTGAYAKYENNYYIQKYAFSDATESRGWFLYRAGTLHLRYAEAVNRAGYPMLAWVLVNNGLANNYIFRRADGTQYPNDSIKVTGTSPKDPYPYPYSFDARFSDPPRPYIRAPWRSSGGIRGRANMPNINFPSTAVTKHDSIMFMEKVIAREDALELGLEGKRWEDLVRISHRMNKENPGSGDRFFWDDNIAKKYQRNGLGGADLSSEDKWFLPMVK